MYLSELQDLQPGEDQAACPVRFITPECWLAVAGARAQRHSVRPGGREDSFTDELGNGIAAVEPGTHRRHREADVLRDQLNECVNVGELPGPHIGLKQTADPR